MERSKYFKEFLVKTRGQKRRDLLGGESNETQGAVSLGKLLSAIITGVNETDPHTTKTFFLLQNESSFLEWQDVGDSDDERHVLLVGQFGLLAQPEAVVDGEGVDGDGQVLGVDLGEFFAAGVIPLGRQILLVLDRIFMSI